MIREKYLDIAKGIGIILVIYGHCALIEEFDLIKKIIYGFHMPMFFIISGILLAKKENKFNYKKTVKKYFIYYVIFTFIIQISTFAKDLLRGENLDFCNILKKIIYGFLLQDNYGGLWFIVSLLFVEVFFSKTVSLFKKKNYIILTLIILCAIIYILNIYNDCLILGWLLLGFIFFSIGNIVEYNHLLEKMINSKLLLLLSFIIFLICAVCNEQVDIVSCTVGYFPLFILSSLSGSLFILNLSYLFQNKKNILFDFLATFGKDSIIVYGTHHPIIQIVRYPMLIIKNMYLRNFIIFLIIVVIENYILIFYNRKGSKHEKK